VEHRPTILIAATDRWYPTARLGMALTQVGCIVDAVCPAGHPLELTNAARRLYDYNGLAPLRSFTHAVHHTNPDLVIPADDLATRHLHDLYQRGNGGGKTGAEICHLIRRSLGDPTGFVTILERSAFINLARQEGIRVPNTVVLADKEDLLDWISREGFPAVLKANGTSGGDGVKILNTLEDAERAWRKLQAPPLLARALKRSLLDRDLTLLRPCIRRQRHVVNAQAFVRGHEATSTVACWEGNVLAGLHFEVVEKMGTTGHATVVRQIEHPEMTAAASKIARRLKLSGIHGLDFMLEAETGDAYLIEINPRTTQVGHLALGDAHDLPAALAGALIGQTISRPAIASENDMVALFPQEWKRNPKSPYLATAYHDVPWQEPAMVSACARQALKHARQVSPAYPPKKAAQSTEAPTPLVAEQNKI